MELAKAIKKLQHLVRQYQIECPLCMDDEDIEAIKTVLQALAS